MEYYIQIRSYNFNRITCITVQTEKGKAVAEGIAARFFPAGQVIASDIQPLPRNEEIEYEEIKTPYW